MASGRMPLPTPSNNEPELRRQIRVMVRTGAEFRKVVRELALVVGRYNDANTDIASDSGLDAGNVQAFKDLLARAAGEMGGTNLVDVLTGAQSMTRTLLDSMA